MAGTTFLHGDPEAVAIAATLASLFTLAAVTIGVYLMRQHAKHYTQPHLQVSVIRILFMVPLYSIDSLISLFVGDYRYIIILHTLRDWYEAYVIYLFVHMCISYAGGEHVLASIIEQDPPFHHPWPLTCFVEKRGAGLLAKCKRYILQFVWVKLVVSFAIIVLELNDAYHEGSFNPNTGYLYTCIIYNTSISYALYYLVIFYIGTRDVLKPFSPAGKFLAIKAVIFFSWWQGVILAGMVQLGWIPAFGGWTTEAIVTRVQDFLICVEMCIAALFHIRIFSYADFIDYTRPKMPHQTNALKDAADVRDVVEDTLETFQIKQRVVPIDKKPMLKNHYEVTKKEELEEELHKRRAIDEERKAQKEDQKISRMHSKKRTKWERLERRRVGEGGGCDLETGGEDCTPVVSKEGTEQDEEAQDDKGGVEEAAHHDPDV